MTAVLLRQGATVQPVLVGLDQVHATEEATAGVIRLHEVLEVAVLSNATTVEDIDLVCGFVHDRLMNKATSAWRTLWRVGDPENAWPSAARLRIWSKTRCLASASKALSDDPACWVDHGPAVESGALSVMPVHSSGPSAPYMARVAMPIQPEAIRPVRAAADGAEAPLTKVHEGCSVREVGAS